MERLIGDDPALFLGHTPRIDSILHQAFAPSGTDGAAFTIRAADVERRLLAGTQALGVTFRTLDT